MDPATLAAIASAAVAGAQQIITAASAVIAALEAKDEAAALVNLDAMLKASDAMTAALPAELAQLRLDLAAAIEAKFPAAVDPAAPPMAETHKVTPAEYVEELKGAVAEAVAPASPEPAK